MDGAIARRRLLAGAAGLGAAALAGCSPDAGTVPPTSPIASNGVPTPTPTSARVLVIGAGASGLAAARSLADAGVAVEVLEARDRIGGRVFTSTAWSDLPIDLGASWIHGERGNPVTQLARDAGARTVATSYDSAVEIVSPGLRRAGLTEPDTARWEGLVDRALVRVGDADADGSVQAAVRRALGSTALSDAERADLGYYLDGTVSTEWGATPDEVSAWTGDDGREFAGSDLLLPDGYGAVFAHLARGLSVRLSAPVTAVRADASGVVVRTSGGELRAEAAVVTVPLGVLKAGALSIEPGLSDAARAAVDRVGFGVLSKSFLRFDEVFWPSDVDWIGHVGAATGHWGQWLSLAKLGAPVLLGFHGGALGRNVEAMDAAAVIADAHAALRDMFGSRARSARQVQTSQWSRDEWARGSYSFNAVGTTRADRLALAAPLAGRIFWAGEATEPDYHSTVHGAVLSGRRAAREVLDRLR